MNELAARRTAIPAIGITAADDVDQTTKLMGCLSGNILTMASSGSTQGSSLSTVWQLFSTGHVTWFIPDTWTAWSWYLDLVYLYQFTGWPTLNFDANIKKFLDTCIPETMRSGEHATTTMHRFIDYCTSYRIQIMESRTVLVICMKMLYGHCFDVKSGSCLVTEHEDVSPLQNTAEHQHNTSVLYRLLTVLRKQVGKKTTGAHAIYSYLKRLAEGAERNSSHDLWIVDTYIRRAGIFRSLKRRLVQLLRTCACNLEIADCCRQILQLLDVTTGRITWPDMAVDEAFTHIFNDADLKQQPWLMDHSDGNANIEALDEALLGHVLHNIGHETHDAAFMSSVDAAFIGPPGNVCKVLNIPEKVLRVFFDQLRRSSTRHDSDRHNNDFIWSDLEHRFGMVVAAFVESRDRDSVNSTELLFSLEGSVPE